eukprot:gene11220-19766_t
MPYNRTHGRAAMKTFGTTPIQSSGYCTGAYGAHGGPMHCVLRKACIRPKNGDILMIDP